LTAILIASMPLFVALLAVRLSPADKPTGLRLLGLVIGLGGWWRCSESMSRSPEELLGAALVLVATLATPRRPSS